MDEVFVNISGEPFLLWRAFEQHGTELDILLQKRRDKAAAKLFFQRLANPEAPIGPHNNIIDQLHSYPAVTRRYPRSVV